MRWRKVWSEIRRVRRVVTGALEIERANKRIGSSLEAAPVVHIADSALLRLVAAELAGEHGEAGLAEVAITSELTVVAGAGAGRRLPPRRRAGGRGRIPPGPGHQMRAVVENPSHRSGAIRNIRT